MRLRYIFIFMLLAGCGGSGASDGTSYQYAQPETLMSYIIDAVL